MSLRQMHRAFVIMQTFVLHSTPCRPCSMASALLILWGVSRAQSSLRNFHNLSSSKSNSRPGLMRGSTRGIMTQFSVAVSTAGTSTTASNVAATTTTPHRGAAAVTAVAWRSLCCTGLAPTSKSVSFLSFLLVCCNLPVRIVHRRGLASSSQVLTDHAHMGILKRPSSL